LALVYGRGLCASRRSALFPLILLWCLTALVLPSSWGWCRVGILFPFVTLRVRSGSCADYKYQKCSAKISGAFHRSCLQWANIP
jgi:hypothetical protein